jgi:hypothetical protein
MSIKTIEDILPLVEKPSRYLGGEINQIKKDPDSVKLRFALAFPDLYEIGTSHFGMQRDCRCLLWNPASPLIALILSGSACCMN